MDRPNSDFKWRQARNMQWGDARRRRTTDKVSVGNFEFYRTMLTNEPFKLSFFAKVVFSVMTVDMHTITIHLSEVLVQITSGYRNIKTSFKKQATVKISSLSVMTTLTMWEVGCRRHLCAFACNDAILTKLEYAGSLWKCRYRPSICIIKSLHFLDRENVSLQRYCIIFRVAEERKWSQFVPIAVYSSFLCHKCRHRRRNKQNFPHSHIDILRRLYIFTRWK